MTPLKDSEKFYIQRNQTHFNELLAHYVWVATMDKEYAWKRVLALAESTKYTHDQYGSLPDALKAEMLRRKSQGQLIGSCTSDALRKTG